ILGHFIRLCIDNPHTSSPVFLVVIENRFDDGMVNHSQISGFHRSGQSRTIATEKCTKRATPVTHISILTLRPTFELPRFHLGEMSYSVGYQLSVRVMRFDALFDLLLYTIELDGFQKFAVRELGQTFLAPADADESVYVIVPGLDISISDGPVHPMTIGGMYVKFVITPAIRASPPYQRTTPSLITPEPQLWLILRGIIGVLGVFYKKMF